MANLSNINNKFIVSDAGHVSIGNVTTNTYLVHAKSSGINNAILALESSSWSAGASAELRLSYVAGHERSIKGGYATGLEFYTNNATPAITILPGGSASGATGNVGIGTDSPRAKLDIRTPDPSANFEVLDFRNTSDFGIFATSSSISGKGNTLDFKSSDYNSGAGIQTRNLLSLQPSGNVGIGTDSPDAKLDIEQAAAGTTFVPYLQLSQTYTVASSKYGILFKNTEYGWDQAKISVERQSSAADFDLVLSSANSGNLVEGIRIDHLGNVGINTTSPTHKLDVTTSDASTWAVALKNTNANGYGLFVQGSETTNRAILAAYSGSSYKLWVRGDGNVGIGTTDPDAKLHIDENTSNSYGTLRLEGSNRGGIIEMYNATYPVSKIQTDQSGNIGIYTSGAFAGSTLTEKFSIGTTGTVGIGDNNVNYKLRVKSDATVTNGVYISAGTSSSNHVLYVEDKDATAEYFAVRGDGEIRFNATSGHTYAAKGIRFGANATANNLDDYEEGTWNVGISSAGANMTNIAFTNEKYTKIGNLVTYSFNLSGSFTSAATESVVGFNLPFTADSTQYKSVGIVSFFIGAAPNRFGLGAIFLGTTSATLGFIYIAGREVQQSGAWGDMRITATYFTA